MSDQSLALDNDKPIVDDKLHYLLPFLLPLVLNHHRSTSSCHSPFIIGLNGVQGIGKTTLVSSLARTLQHSHDLETLIMSIDDFYLTHEDQVRLAAEQWRNPLVQHRGEPGTHDVGLLHAVLKSLVEGQEVAIPAYDKSAFAGRGDRIHRQQWRIVNSASQPQVQVIILEGWCAGFRSLAEAELKSKVEASRVAGKGTLYKHRLESLYFINEKLKTYEEAWDCFDTFVQLDAEELSCVYEWREEAEDAIRKKRGDMFGMTKEQVRTFVDGYMPAYELYTQNVRRGIFVEPSSKGGVRVGMKQKQLRLMIGTDRKVKSVVEL